MEGKKYDKKPGVTFESKQKMRQVIIIKNLININHK